jgi:pantetheine-phosphate adenylyltransferase
MRIAVYPGTFDPVTNGHLDIVSRAARQFDRLIIAILKNQEKAPMFDLAQRTELLKDAVREFPNVKVESFDGLLVDYAMDVGASMIVRGIRAFSDFEYEMQMAMLNRRMQPKLEAVFMMPSESYSYLSSRLVREVASLGGDLDGLVPEGVRKALMERLRPVQ